MLDRDFFTRLQDVSSYNPTASDKALISSEFKRVFAGNTDPLVASWLNSIDVAAETTVLNSDLNGDIINTQNSGGVNNNGTDSRADIYKNDNRYSEMQTEGQTGGVSQIGNNENITKRRTIQPDRYRYRGIETGSLDAICESDAFVKLSRFVGNEISEKTRDGLYRKYKNDTRITSENYDFSDVVTYDMLTNPDNELRGLFADEIEAYLDKASLANLTPVYIIHGHGTGALKQAVRDFLSTSPYVAKFRPGESSEGGDGVCVVDIN